MRRRRTILTWLTAGAAVFGCGRSDETPQPPAATETSTSPHDRALQEWEAFGSELRRYRRPEGSSLSTAAEPAPSGPPPEAASAPPPPTAPASPQEEPAKEAKAEDTVRDFFATLRRLDLRALSRMARGEAKRFLESRADVSDEMKRDIDDIEQGSAKYVNANEYHVELISRRDRNRSPGTRLVFRRDEGRWWLDEIIELRKD